MKYLFLLVPLLLMGATAKMTDAGKVLYEQNCVSCHGVDGRGAGPVAVSLDTPPADLTGIAARRGGVWPMLEIMAILDGYNRNALPREDMPVFENFLDNEMSEFDTGNGVPTLVPTKLIEIVHYLELIQDPAPSSYVP